MHSGRERSPTCRHRGIDRSAMGAGAWVGPARLSNSARRAGGHRRGSGRRQSEPSVRSRRRSQHPASIWPGRQVSCSSWWWWDFGAECPI